MPLSVILSALLLLLILFALLCGVVGSWAWVIWRVQNRQAIVPSLVETPRVPWGLGSVVLVILTWITVNTAVYLVYSKTTEAAVEAVKVAGGPAVTRTLGFTEQLFLVSLTNLVLLAVIPVLLRLVSGARLAHLGLVRRGLLPQITIGAIAFFLVSPFVYAINGLAILIWKPESHPLEKMVRNEHAMGIVELAVLSAVILAPATEELLFRGVIQRWLRRMFALGSVDVVVSEGKPRQPADGPFSEDFASFEVPPGPWNEVTARPDDNPNSSAPLPTTSVAARPHSYLIQPIVLTSFLFAAVHFPQWPAPLGIFVLSLGLGYLAEKSGSLIAAMVMHSLFNGLSTVLLLVIVQLGSLAIPTKEKIGKAVPRGVISVQAITEASREREAETVPHFSDQ